MSIQIDDARVVGLTTNVSARLQSSPAGSATETERGGIVPLEDDPNPGADRPRQCSAPWSKANTGDNYAGLTVGVVDDDFRNSHLMAT